MKDLKLGILLSKFLSEAELHRLSFISVPKKWTSKKLDRLQKWLVRKHLDIYYNKRDMYEDWKCAGMALHYLIDGAQHTFLKSEVDCYWCGNTFESAEEAHQKLESDYIPLFKAYFSEARLLGRL